LKFWLPSLVHQRAGLRCAGDERAGHTIRRLGSVAPDPDVLLGEVEDAMLVVGDAALCHRSDGERPHHGGIDRGRSGPGRLPLLDGRACRADSDTCAPAPSQLSGHPCGAVTIPVEASIPTPPTSIAPAVVVVTPGTFSLAEFDRRLGPVYGTSVEIC
jgi:hypothetical protein